MEGHDMSLDDIIMQSKREFRHPRARGRFWPVRGRSRSVSNAVPEELLEMESSPSTAATKLIISNLDENVSNEDLKKAFKDFDPVNVAVHYDRLGKSLGTADIVFKLNSDAAKAMKLCNNMPLNGKAICIEMTFSSIPSSVRGLSSTPRTSSVSYDGRAYGGRRWSGSRRGWRGRAPSSKELDAELDAYFKQTARRADLQP